MACGWERPATCGGLFHLCECVHGCSGNEANRFTRLLKKTPGAFSQTHNKTHNCLLSVLLSRHVEGRGQLYGLITGLVVRGRTGTQIRTRRRHLSAAETPAVFGERRELRVTENPYAGVTEEEIRRCALPNVKKTTSISKAETFPVSACQAEPKPNRRDGHRWSKRNFCVLETCETNKK